MSARQTLEKNTFDWGPLMDMKLVNMSMVDLEKFSEPHLHVSSWSFKIIFPLLAAVLLQYTHP